MKFKETIAGQKIIIALDGLRDGEALKIAKSLKGKVWGFKITDLLYENTAIIRKLKKFGKVFADAKLHDIPNTVSNSVAKLSAAGADFITVHASGGVEMMKAAKKSAGKSQRKIKIIAVTVLTSFAFSSTNTEKEVLKLTRAALAAKVDGIVCSGRELKLLSKNKDFSLLLKIVPGIRPSSFYGWYKKADDQACTVTPGEALNWGADYLVIGRPIVKSKDPVKALEDL